MTVLWPQNQAAEISASVCFKQNQNRPVHGGKLEEGKVGRQIIICYMWC